MRKIGILFISGLLCTALACDKPGDDVDTALLALLGGGADLSGAQTTIENIPTIDGTDGPVLIEEEPEPEIDPTAIGIPDPDPVVVGPPPPPPPPGVCTMTGAKIINMSRQLGDISSCYRGIFLFSESLVVQCAADAITDALKDEDPECLKAFDVYVPGTAAENGDWKQFNALANQENGRAHISLQYQNATLWDGIFYGLGVKDAHTALTHVLKAIRTKHGTDDIRVFGHSKGSHTVAVAADHPDHADHEFYAFGQTASTVKTIEFKDETFPAGKLGRAGAITKLSHNLVAINWKNDEVRLITDNAPAASMPERWGYPGWIRENRDWGTIYPFRIDHHTNYGGLFVTGWDAIKSYSDAQLLKNGMGSKKSMPTYCMSGNKNTYSVLAEGHCAKTDTKGKPRAFVAAPYFWGNADCEAKAYDMMENAGDGDYYTIGNSGPRAANCREDNDRHSMRYEIVHRRTIKDDKDCAVKLRVHFYDNAGKWVDYIKLDRTGSHSWQKTKGYVSIPYSGKMRIEARMYETRSWKYADCGSVLPTKVWISYLRITNLKNPVTGVKKVRYPIRGWQEGAFDVTKLTGGKKVGWRRHNSGKTQDSWDLWWSGYYKALKISGGTNDHRHGNFEKNYNFFD